MRVRTINLRPVEGRRIRHRDGTILAAKGEAVPANSYYLRLLDAGDLEEFKPQRKSRRRSVSKGSKPA